VVHLIQPVGLTWVSNEEQGKKMWEASTANNKANQDRQDSINKVADKISADISKRLGAKP